MLNYTFSKSVNRSVSGYIAPDNVVLGNLHANESFDHGHEYRWQGVYGDEIWLKLERAGLTPSNVNQLSVLEVCAGMGFLTYHLLSRCMPKHLVVNDISSAELTVAKDLIKKNYPTAQVDWNVGDMHTVHFDRKFDLIIGNSFLHHFHNVPQVLSRFESLLTERGVFISLHEPTPMSTVVEGAKLVAYPLAVLAPGLVNNIVRDRYAGEPSSTDLWMFEPAKLKRVARAAGFNSVVTHPWHLCRTITAQKNNLHLSADKPQLTREEEPVFRKAIYRDASLSKWLPQRFFGSFCIVCRK